MKSYKGEANYFFFYYMCILRQMISPCELYLHFLTILSNNFILISWHPAYIMASYDVTALIHY